MTATPHVSLIVPAYNQGGFVAETLDSLLSQDYADREIIVLDDGSTDDTPEVLRRYADVVQVVRHDNMGENRTVNRGLQMARGRILCVVNADDPLLPGAVRSAVEHLADDGQAIAAYPDWQEIDHLGHVLRTLHLPDYTIRTMLLDCNVAMGPGVFFRREALEEVGLRNPDLRYTGDLDYWYRLARHHRFRHIPQVLATHRVHPAAASSAARGGRMAAEVVRLVDEAFRHAPLPADVRRQKSRIYAKVHHAALHCCGASRRAAWWHGGLSRAYALFWKAARVAGLSAGGKEMVAPVRITYPSIDAGR
jgi:GT2 family glycosyltransferase